MDTSNLKAINDLKVEKALSEKRHQELLNTQAIISDTVLSTTTSLIRYLEGHTTKTQVVNQLKSVNTPDALRIIPYLEKLDKTLQTHENTDLTEITSVMNSILDEAKKIPKELPEEQEQKFVDYTDQFKSLADAIKAVEKVVKEQELIAEAPVVNVPETNVNVDAPDLKPLQTGLKDVVKAVNKIVIPEYKTDNAGVESLIKKSNKLLGELINKPVSVGGGGGSSWVAVNTAGTPIPIQLDADGAVPISSPTYKLLLDDTSTASVTYVGKAAIGSATTDAVWQIQKIDETTGMQITWANNGLFTAKWTEILTETYT